MNLIDRIILEWSFRTKKGYPDLNNEEDILLFESLFGFDITEPLNEATTLTFDELSDKAKKVAIRVFELMDGRKREDLSEEEKKQIKGFSSNKFNIYVPAEDRPIHFQTIDDSGEFGKSRQIRSGNWKTEDGVIFSLKPSGASAGEYFELKPQQLGLTLDKKVPLSQVRDELIRGIKDNKKLNDVHKRALIYALTDTGNVSDEERENLEKGFFNEVNKNFGEPHGAILFGGEIGADSVEFPAAGNYPLIDYILYKGDERIQVSAKAGKTMGNTVKYNDVVRLVDLAGGEVPPKIREFVNIITSNRVVTGAFEAIERFGSSELKKAVEDYKEQYPQYPNLGNKPEDRQSHADRIKIEKAFVKDLNADPDFNFNGLFNEYVEVKYLKYFLDTKTLKGVTSLIDTGNFNVKHHSKNSPGHDSDKLGLSVSKAKQ